MLQNIIISIISIIVLIWGSFFLIGIFWGIITFVLNLIFYSSIMLVVRFITSIFRQMISMLKWIYFKIYNKILDKIYPDKGAYLIDFGKINKKGLSKIRYISIR